MSPLNSQEVWITESTILMIIIKYSCSVPIYLLTPPGCLARCYMISLKRRGAALL